MNGNISLRHIQQLEPLVLDTEWFVELLISIHRATGLALSSVQYMGHANLLQVESILRCSPEQ